ncbi:hypothetical protein AB3S75_042364 [Citrus x aurantiifolia]
MEYTSPATSPPRGGSPQPWYEIYQLETYTEQIPIPQGAETRSHEITTAALCPEPLRETRCPTFTHNLEVGVP